MLAVAVYLLFLLEVLLSTINGWASNAALPS